MVFGQNSGFQQVVISNADILPVVFVQVYSPFFRFPLYLTYVLLFVQGSWLQEWPRLWETWIYLGFLYSGMFCILLRRSQKWVLPATFSGVQPKPTSFPTQSPINTDYLSTVSRSINGAIRGWFEFVFEVFVALTVFKFTRRFFLSSYFQRLGLCTKVDSHRWHH